MKSIRGSSVFYSALIGEVLVLTVYLLDKFGVIGFGFLWLNVVGALSVVVLSWLMQKLLPAKQIEPKKIVL
jgi:hypothetical protein